jgi:MFS family permease
MPHDSADTMVTRRSHLGGWDLLKSRDFGLLFAGQIISQIGDSLNKVALLWFVYEVTGSALKMTAIGLLQTLPPLVFGPLIGVYLDRFRKKPVMIGVDLLRTGLVLLIPALFLVEALTLHRLYVLVFINAIVSTVFGPALSSAVPLIVPKERLMAANALMQSTANVGLLIGPAMSGLGIALLGAQNVLVVDAATFLISALCLIGIRVPESIHRTVANDVRRDLATGFRFMFSEQKLLLVLMLVATAYNLGISAFLFLLPVFAKEILAVGPVQLGWLWSGLGAGMLAASLGLAFVKQGQVSRRLNVISSTMVVGGLAMGALQFVQTPFVAGSLIIIIGSSIATFTPLIWTTVQELTPAPLLGRVFSSFATGGMASSMVGMAASGWAADTFGAGVTLGSISFILLTTAAMARIWSGHTAEMVSCGAGQSKDFTSQPVAVAS